MSNRTAILVMPRLNANEDEAQVVGLPPREGNRFAAGDILFSIETTKAATDIPAPCDGRVQKVLVDLNDMIEVGAPICEVEFEQASALEGIDYVWADEPAGSSEPASCNTHHVSAKARLRARELGVDIALVSAANASVRVTDVERYFQDAQKNIVAAGPAELKDSYSERDAIILGGSGHARAIIDAARESGLIIVGAIDAKIPPGSSVGGAITVWGGEDLLATLRQRGLRKAIIGVGGATSNAARQKVYRKLSDLGFELPSIVAPGAYLSAESTIGPATYLLPGANVGPGVTIGANCIINQNVVVAHDSQIADDVHLAPNAVVAGHCTIGRGSTVGMCATLINGSTIGANCLIHNNVPVTSDLPDGTVLTLADVVRRAKTAAPLHV